jgi:hypothetical protein
MDMRHPSLNAAAAADSATPVPFDVLRAMISARQAATPTARLVASRAGTLAAVPGQDRLIDLFARGIGHAGMGGGFARGEASGGQDEQHA